MRAVAALTVVLVLAGCIDAPAEPSDPAAPASAASVAKPDAAPTTGPFEAQGASSFSVIGACTMGVCSGIMDGEEGELEVPANLTAELIAEWDAAKLEEMHVIVRSESGEVGRAAGTSPLAVSVQATAGTYRVVVWPQSTTGPVDVEVGWTVAGKLTG